MSTQQLLFMDTILAVRKALKRKAYDSDSDSSIERNTNRGYKLKKRARFVRQGHLASQAIGTMAHKEIGELAGYQRALISQNPPMIDNDGYDVESDDNEERLQEAMERREEDVYSSVHIEQLLAPLTAVTDLPNHPTLSRPFTSKALTELAAEGCNLMHKENKALWKVKPLLTKLLGDSTWAPCGIMTGPHDFDMFREASLFLSRAALSSAGPASPQTYGEIPYSSVRREGLLLAEKKAARNTNQIYPTSAERKDPEWRNGINGRGDMQGAKRDNRSELVFGKGPEAEGKVPRTNGRTLSPEPSFNGAQEHSTKSNGGDVQMAEALEGERRRGEASEAHTGALGKALAHHDDVNQAQPAAVVAMAAAEAGEDQPFIHPFFLPPPSARPDRNLGLPSEEADEIRRLVQLYVQKQEEVCRGSKRLYEGLLKADRLRKTVLRWAKAEAHCGPNRDMSDGEDWYDREEWGLTEDLKKGQDEEEEDTTQQQQQKKTRARR